MLRWLRVTGVQILLTTSILDRTDAFLHDNYDPTGPGRILRNGDSVFVEVVEGKDATDAERRITEVIVNMYVFIAPRIHQRTVITCAS